MGVHFFALVNCEQVFTVADERLARLESAGGVGSQRLIDMLQPGSGYTCVPEAWVPASDFSEVSDRPNVITAACCFRTKENFHLTFGADSVGIWHPLRWPRFIRDGSWQSAMLDACDRLCALFDARKCVITRDGSPLRRLHLKGALFDEILHAASDHEPKVDDISELYTVVNEIGNWDSKGFWQLPLRSPS